MSDEQALTRRRAPGLALAGAAPRRRQAADSAGLEAHLDLAADQLRPRRPKARILLVATNVGAKATGGADHAHRHPARRAGTHGKPSTRRPTTPAPPTLNCAIAGQNVTCTSAGPVRPGYQLEVRISVKAPPPRPNAAVPTKASISGGGAPDATTSSPVVIDPSAGHFGFLSGTLASTPAHRRRRQPPTRPAPTPTSSPSTSASPPQLPGGELTSAGHLRDLSVDLPRGLIEQPRRDAGALHRGRADQRARARLPGSLPGRHGQRHHLGRRSPPKPTQPPLQHGPPARRGGRAWLRRARRRHLRPRPGRGAKRRRLRALGRVERRSSRSPPTRSSAPASSSGAIPRAKATTASAATASQRTAGRHPAQCRTHRHRPADACPATARAQPLRFEARADSWEEPGRPSENASY